jgi:hypothetical protein
MRSKSTFCESVDEILRVGSTTLNVGLLSLKSLYPKETLKVGHFLTEFTQLSLTIDPQILPRNKVELTAALDDCSRSCPFSSLMSSSRPNIATTVSHLLTGLTLEQSCLLPYRHLFQPLSLEDDTCEKTINDSRPPPRH